MTTSKPHGGRLVNRIKSMDAGGLDKIMVDNRSALDLELIGVGAYSPLQGFMGREDYEWVLTQMRLSNDGLPWPIPITLSVDEEIASTLVEGDDYALIPKGEVEPLATLHLEEKYAFDKKKEAELVYKTTEKAHPGVNYLYNRGSVQLGGKIRLLRHIEYTDLLDYRFNPVETRKIFAERGWKTVVGFQTRNPIHRAHEYIQKSALEMVDGLFIHPLVGETKSDDIPADVRIRCYETMIENYYPKDRVFLGVFPAAMRYAGPREAVFHALVRKNYGCTHFTVGRDHAGVGDYYGSFDAHKIFQEFDPQEIGIVPLFFDNVFYCRGCDNMASFKTCPHEAVDRVTLSGTKVREILANGEHLPKEFTRPEVSKILLESTRKDD
jgi:sulfate adenylyltransferase